MSSRKSDILHFELSLMLLKSVKFHTKFKEKLTCHPTTQKSENVFLMGSVCPKYIMLELQK